MQMLSTMNITDDQPPQYDVLDELMGFVPETMTCSMCYFSITIDRPFHDDTGICVNCFSQLNNGDFSLECDGLPTEKDDTTNCCVLCINKITQDRMRHNNSNICVVCVDMLNSCNYELVLNDNKTEPNPESKEESTDFDAKSSGTKSSETPVPQSNLATPIRDSERFIDDHYHSVNRKDCNDALLASLYSQVEFMRKQLQEETLINRNLVKYIMSMSGIKLDSGIPEVSSVKPQTLARSESSSTSSGEYSENEGENETEIDRLFEGYCQPPPPQQQQQQQRQQQQQLPERKDTKDQMNDYIKNKHAEYTLQKENEASVDKQFAPWEKHSTRYGSKLMSKWGYAGGGLGKDGTGITSPIKAASSTKSSTGGSTWVKGTTLIIGDSMLNGIKEERLKRYNAKVEACPGATIKDMYGVVTPLLAKKPAKVILHVGTNDAPFKPSHAIVNELIVLRKYIESNLPGGKVVLSGPIMRTDNRLANAVIREIITAFKTMPNTILNDKIDVFCLGRKGLHLNNKGSGKLALNFISEMQCV